MPPSLAAMPLCSSTPVTMPGVSQLRMSSGVPMPWSGPTVRPWSIGTIRALPEMGSRKRLQRRLRAISVMLILLEVVAWDQASDNASRMELETILRVGIQLASIASSIRPAMVAP